MRYKLITSLILFVQRARKAPIITGIKAVAEELSIYPHNPRTISEIELIKLAFNAFIIKLSFLLIF